jgi:hypothetical protein
MKTCRTRLTVVLVYPLLAREAWMPVAGWVKPLSTYSTKPDGAVMVAGFALFPMNVATTFAVLQAAPKVTDGVAPCARLLSDPATCFTAAAPTFDMPVRY